MSDEVTEIVVGSWCIPYQRSGHFAALNQKMHSVANHEPDEVDFHAGKE